MAKITIFNVGKANAVIDAANTAADAALVSAKIATIKFDGKEVSAADAPLYLKIAAIASLAGSGEKTQDVSELITSNGLIAAQVEELTGKLATATATIGSNNQKITSLESDLTTQKASVQSLTAQLTTTNTNLEASNKLNTSLTGASNAVNAEISKHCLSVNCLTLTGPDGKPLAADATDAEKLESANKIPVAEKITALMGAVHSAAAKIGVDIKMIPSSAAAAPGSKEKGGKKKTADELCADHVASNGVPRLTVLQRK